MAQKRMFTMKIVDSDAFLDMPLSAQCLYFHLNMRADDDGFVGNPKKIMRMIGASEDDMKILIAKKFIIIFESNIIVIKHWWMHNTLAKDRYAETVYRDEKSELMVKENRSYTLDKEYSNHPVVEEYKKKTIEYSEARKKRIQARKDSNLPTYFDNMIRNAFNHKNCPVCNVEMDVNDTQFRPTIQHNIPISKGGKHELNNISVICQRCNCSLQNRVETPAYNTNEVIFAWECLQNNRECFGNVNTDLDKDLDLNLDKDINLNNNADEDEKIEIANINPFILKDTSKWYLSLSLYELYKKTYANINVDQELLKIQAWLISNPAKRKTKAGMSRFINNWLSNTKSTGYYTKKDEAAKVNLVNKIQLEES